MKKVYTCFLFLCLIGSFLPGFAHITVNSVHVTTSTCPNNGTATIFASSTSDSAVFLYNIVAGPVLYPLQNDSTFASLYPGTYTAWVHDINSYDSTETTFTISGNYTPPVITATEIAPLCQGDSDGLIIGALQPATGLGPFTWAIALPDTTPPQASSTFSNLPPGSYRIKITDACNVVRTDNIVLPGGSGLGLSFTGFSDYFTGCDTLLVRGYFNLEKSRANLPVKITTYTSNGTTVRSFIPVPYDTTDIPATYTFSDTIRNINFGDYLNICLTDTCHETSCLPFGDTLTPFKFKFTFSPVTTNCVVNYRLNIQLQSSPSYLLVGGDYVPLTIILENTNTHTIIDSIIAIDSFSLFSGFPVNLVLPAQPDTVFYQITIKDRCGNVFTGPVQWPTPPVVYTTEYVNSNICLDSTNSTQFSFFGFSSAVTLELLSGPTFSESTWPGYAYRDTLIYPIYYTTAKLQYTIENMPAGNYTFKVSDSCGNVYNSSFTVSLNKSLVWKLYVEPECGGGSNLDFLPPNAGTGVDFQVHNLSTYAYIPVIFVDDTFSCPALLPGKYLVGILFGQDQDTLLTGNNHCWTFRDTITIPGYNDSILKATDIATCNGTIYIHIEVDSSNGILPFQYEIIHGPETFAPQDTANFVVHTFGTYLIGVLDACGNVDTRQVSIDSGRFDPVARSGGWCAGSSVQLSDVSSPFYTYTWKKPNGSVYTGDTLIINPFTAADTGTYHITKVVDINGCRDTASGSYYLAFKDTFQQSVSFCPGDTLHVGPYIHTTSGTYTDTLTGVGGCDSIEITTLNTNGVAPAINPAHPPVCRTFPVTLTASGGTTYHWSTLQDTAVITVNPSVTTVYTVTVSTGSNCSATASVTVYPASDSTVQLTPLNSSICSTDSATICAPAGFTTYRWNNGGSAQCISTRQAGSYYVTATNTAGCIAISDSANVTVAGPASAAIAPATPPVCHTMPVTLTATGGTTYRWSDLQDTAVITVNPVATTVYTVTVSTGTNCSGTASVTVYPATDSTVTLTQNKTIICPNDSATICAAAGFATYSWNVGETSQCITTSLAGNYYVTATNSLGCSVNSHTAHLVVYSPTSISLTVSGDTISSQIQRAYQWYLNNEPIVGDTLALIIARTPGNYTVQVTDSNGCVNISNPVMITGMNDIMSGDDEIKVYPNPTANGAWQIEISNSLIGSHCEVFDAEGRLVYQGRLDNSKSTVAMQILSGIYLMKIESAKSTYSVKLIQF